MNPHQVHTRLLDNGLRLVIVPQPHLHTATLAAFVQVGSRFEAPADNGLSHFLEHMLFRGTERHASSYELSLAAESLGGPLYADTGRDYSSLQLALDPARVQEGLALVAEVLTRPRFDDIELERRLILEELTEDYDERGKEINGDDIVRGLIYGAHPLAQRVIGPRANVERFGQADVVRHHQRYYVARNTVLCATGRVDPDEVIRWATESFAGFMPGTEAHSAPPSFDASIPHYRYVSDSGSQSSLNVVFESVSETDPEYVASLVLARILDDGMSARLHYRVCDQKGLAYSIQGSLDPLHDVALLDIASDSAHANVLPLVRELLAIVSELRHTAVLADELDRVKQRYRFDLSALEDDPAAMAGWFGATALYYPPPTLSQRLAQVESITADQVRAVARRIIQPDRLAVAIVGTLSAARQSELRSAIFDWR